MKRPLYKHLAVACLLLLHLSDSLAAGGDKPSAVTVVEVVAKSLQEEIPLAGSAEALRESALSSRVAGVVKEVHVSEGDRVEAGQLILSLDPAIAELEVA